MTCIQKVIDLGIALGEGPGDMERSRWSTDQAARKPRVLGIVPPAPVRVEEVKAPVGLEPRTPHAIPRSQFARIRALVKYGMTVAEVAGVYGVAVGDVERILR